MAKTIASFICPKCFCPVDTVVDSIYLFVLYRCPECRSNVVCYGNKVSIVSNRLINKLIASGRLKIFSDKKLVSETSCISEDQIQNLHMLMETEKDFDSFLKKI